MFLDDSKLIFRQLAHIDAGNAVRVVIENHDAWFKSPSVLSQLTVAVRTQLARTPRPANVAQRIALQQTRLQSLAISLPVRVSAAG